MKKFVFLLLLCTGIASYYYIYVNPKDKFSNSFPSPPPYSSPTITWNEIAYGFEYFEINDISQLTLIANFTHKKTSDFLLDENKCQYAINGGFYTINNEPLGLFINDAIQTKTTDSALVNGFISITKKPTISFDLPQNSVVALQTGPMLMVDAKKLKLAIKNDEYARRMIAGVSSKGTLLFMTVFIPETKVQGPQLTDLPDIIEKINSSLPNKIVHAINLDGGNASIFKNTNIFISEVSSVGSIFCLR